MKKLCKSLLNWQKSTKRKATLDIGKSYTDKVVKE